MRPAVKNSLLGLTLVAITIAVVAVYFDWNRLRGFIIETVNERSGRTLRIDGDIDATLSMTPVISIDKISLSNAAWASTEHMLTIERMRVSIALWELIKGRIVLPRLEFYKPVIELERDSQGSANWQFDEGVVVDAAVPDERTEFPLIGQLYIEDGALRLRDATRELDFKGRIATVVGSGGDTDDTIALNAEGSLQKRPFTLALSGGSLLDLRDESQLYPLQLSLQVADTNLSVAGTIDQPLQLRGMDLVINAEGPDLSRLYSLTGAVLPATPPYKVAGELHHRDGLWRVESLHGSIGDSDIAGNFEVNTSGERLFVSADLTSQQLDFDDLGPLIGAPPSAAAGETISEDQRQQAAQLKRTGKVIPDQSFDLSRLRDADAQFHFNAVKVMTPNLPLGSFELDVQLKDAVMTIEPLRLGLANGTVAGRIIVDARQPEISWNYALSLDKLGIGQLADAGTPEDIASGTINGEINLQSRGNSMHEAAKNSDGSIAISVAGGQLSNLIIELIGLDAADSLGLVLSDSVESIPFRCAVGNLSIREGMVTSDALVIDTTDTRIDAELSADLEQESYTLTVSPKPKDISPLSMRTPLHLQGSFRELNIRPDFTSLGLRAGAAVALGTIATPLAALLAFIEPGSGEDADCQQLIAKQ